MRFGAGCLIALFVGELAAVSGSTIAAVGERLHDSDGDVRDAAVGVLFDWEARAAPVLEEIVASLERADTSDPDLLVFTIDRIGAAARPMLPRLRRLAARSKGDLRVFLGRTVGELERSRR